jgi:hypothetical protein
MIDDKTVEDLAGFIQEIKDEERDKCRIRAKEAIIYMLETVRNNDSFPADDKVEGTVADMHNELCIMISECGKHVDMALMSPMDGLAAAQENLARVRPH